MQNFVHCTVENELADCLIAGLTVEIFCFQMLTDRNIFFFYRSMLVVPRFPLLALTKVSLLYY